MTSLLTQVKGLIVAAQEENVDRTKIQTDITQLRNQVDSIVNAAQFNGLSLVKGTGSVNVLASLDRAADQTVTSSSIALDRQNLETAAGGGLETLATVDVSTAAGATAALADIEGLIQTAVDASSEFGSTQKRIEIQGRFISSLTDSLKSGIGALTDADLEQASVRLQSLQIQQQLGLQALSIANQGPGSILALFR